MLSLFDNKYYKIGNPEKLVIFIHGYNGTPEAIDYAVRGLHEKLHNAVIVVPRAPYTCEKNADNLQWLSFFKVDPDMKFRQESTSIEDIFAIFSSLAEDFKNMADKMNEFIDEQQNRFGIDDSHTYVMGFSQGAMIAIYTVLTRRHALAGCVPVAGIVAGRGTLEKQIISKPPFLLLHGKDDKTVQYKTLPTTVKWFDEQGLNWRKFEFDGLAHRMNDAEMQKAAEFINS